VGKLDALLAATEASTAATEKAIVGKLDALLAATVQAATVQADKYARKAALQAAIRWAIDNAEIGEFAYTGGDGHTRRKSGKLVRQVLFDFQAWWLRLSH
jgi:Arc/MetJ family transcription regulator